jgi:predicted deacylase
MDAITTPRIAVGTAISTEQGLATGHLALGQRPDGSLMNTPVMILRGAKPGPTLWLQACIHGDEYCGTFIVQGLLHSLDAADLAGTIVALPLLNITAAEAKHRMSPFEGYHGGDLNRCFPGKPDGTLTEQMAHAIYAALKPQADLLIDLHTALTEDVSWALYANLPSDVGRRGEGIARAFGYRSTLPAPPDILAGSALMTAAHDGIPSFIIEAGGRGPSFTDDVVQDAVERLRNVLRHLGMLEGDVTDYGPLLYFSNFAWVRSLHGGLFERQVRCGDRVEAGSLLGRFYDLHGQLTAEARAPHPGVVLAIHSGPIMPSGDTLVHIGLEPREV